MLDFEKISDVSGAVEAGTFFTDNIDESYISHSEIICGRAVFPAQWVDNLSEVILNEFEDTISGSDEARSAGLWREIVVAKEEGSIVGLFVVLFSPLTPTSYLILEDIVVSKIRRKEGIFKAMFQEVLRLARKEEISIIMLETSAHNASGQSVFGNLGFSLASKSMILKV